MLKISSDLTASAPSVQVAESIRYTNIRRRCYDRSSPQGHAALQSLHQPPQHQSTVCLCTARLQTAAELHLRETDAEPCSDATPRPADESAYDLSVNGQSTNISLYPPETQNLFNPVQVLPPRSLENVQSKADDVICSEASGQTLQGSLQFDAAAEDAVMLNRDRDITTSAKQGKKQQKDSRQRRSIQKNTSCKHSGSDPPDTEDPSTSGVKPAAASSDSGSPQPRTETKRSLKERAAAELTARIQKAQHVCELHDILNESNRLVNGQQVSIMMLKLVQFAGSDPSQWFSPVYRKSLSNPSQLMSSQTQSAHENGPWDSPPSGTTTSQEQFYAGRRAQGDWGMLDEMPESAVRKRYQQQHITRSQQHSSSRQSLRPADPVTQQRAYWRLLQLLGRVTGMACKLINLGQLDHVSLSVVLSSLSKLGYSDEMVITRLFVRFPHSQSTAQHASCAYTSMIWSCTQLKHQPPVEWLRSWEAHMQAQLSTCSAHDLCTCVYALGKLQYKPGPGFLAAACDRSREILATAQPGDAAKFCLGMAGIGHHPGPEWLQHFQSVTEGSLTHFHLPQLKQLLTAMMSFQAKLSVSWTRAFLSQCHSSFMKVTKSRNLGDVSAIISALARVKARPDMQWMESCLQYAQRCFATATPSDLVSLLASLSQLRFRPSDGWMQAYLASCFQRLSAFSHEDVVLLLNSLGLLSFQPPAVWQYEMMKQVQQRLSEFSAPQLAELLQAMARLNMNVPKSWLSDWEVATQAVMQQMDAPSLAATAFALAKLQHQPQVSWLYGFVLQAYSKLDSFDSSQLGLVFDALPKLSHPGWLDELVQICANESTVERRVLGSGSYDELDDQVQTVAQEKKAARGRSILSTQGASGRQPVNAATTTSPSDSTQTETQAGAVDDLLVTQLNSESQAADGSSDPSLSSSAPAQRKTGSAKARSGRRKSLQPFSSHSSMDGGEDLDESVPSPALRIYGLDGQISGVDAYTWDSLAGLQDDTSASGQESSSGSATAAVANSSVTYSNRSVDGLRTPGNSQQEQQRVQDWNGSSSMLRETSPKVQANVDGVYHDPSMTTFHSAAPANRMWAGNTAGANRAFRLNGIQDRSAAHKLQPAAFKHH